MSIRQSRFAAASRQIRRRAGRLSVFAFLLLSTSFVAAAASNLSEANARYQAERAVCNAGQSNQNRATCLREAAAAFKDSSMGRLNADQGVAGENAMKRCDVLPAEDRTACQRRIAGEGTTSGSAGEGGVLRELRVPVKQ